MKLFRDPRTLTQLQVAGGGGAGTPDWLKALALAGNTLQVFGSGNTTGSTNTQSNTQRQSMSPQGAPVTQTNLSNAEYRASLMPRVRRLLKGVGVQSPSPEQINNMFTMINSNGRLADTDLQQMYQQQYQANTNTANTSGSSVAPTINDNRTIVIGGQGGEGKPEEVVPPPEPPPGPDPTPDPGGGGEDITSKMNPLKWVKGSLPGLNWLPMAMAPLSMLGALGEDPVFNRHETSQFWRDDFKREFKGISEDARTDPYQGKFFRNANRAALTSTNVMLANDAELREKQRLAGGQLFAGGTQKALASAAGGFYANQGNLLSRGYDIRDRAAMQENRYVNHNTDMNQQLFQFEVAQGTHSKYNRGMNLVNRVISAGMAGAGMGLDMTGKLYDLTTKRAMAEQNLGHYEGGGGSVEITSRDAEQLSKSSDAGVPLKRSSEESVLFNEGGPMQGPLPDDPNFRMDSNREFINATANEALMGSPMSRRSFVRENTQEGGPMPGIRDYPTGLKKSTPADPNFDFSRDGRWKPNSPLFGGS